MRLFFALWPDDGVRAELARWSRELRASCGGRPVPTPKLHMTLAFLGSVEAERVAELERAARDVVPPSCLLLLDHPGFWKHNRIAWAGASAVPPELEGLVLELRSALMRSRIAFDPKEFAPHVTLLRDARQPRAMPELKAIPWELDGFALVRSPIERGGGPYEVLNSWGLRRRR
jgi:2'-5' RNA ligase